MRGNPAKWKSDIHFPGPKKFLLCAMCSIAEAETMADHKTNVLPDLLQKYRSNLRRLNVAA